MTAPIVDHQTMKFIQSDWQNGWGTPVLPFDSFTGDRRWFSPGSVTSRAVPFPLLLQVQTAQGHTGAVVVGAVERVEYTPSGVFAYGSWLDPAGVPEVNRALALKNGDVAKVSADLEPDMDVRVEEDPAGGRPFVFYDRAKIAGITIVPIAAFDQPSLSTVSSVFEDTGGVTLALTGTASWRSMPAQPREDPYNADEAFQRILAWADGNDGRARSMFLWFDPQAAEGSRDRFRLPIGDIINGRPALNFHAVYAAAALVSGAHGGLPTVSDEEKGRLRRTISEIYGRLSGLYNDPNLSAPWDKRANLPDVKGTSIEAVAASAAPVAPPDEWFTNPKLKAPVSAPIVMPNGRVVVHLATWDSCHRPIMAQTGQCFTPPSSPSAYRRFMDGSVITASGKTVPVGRITVGGTHPSIGLTAAAAKEHYDNTATCCAIVAAGEDDFGIWLSGALVPEATPEQVAALRRSPISGDWRRHGNEGLDLIAALAVNTAGFPAPYRGTVRTLSVDGGECRTLVASGPPMGDDEIVTAPVVETPDVTTSEVDQPPAAPVIDTDAIVAAATAAAVERIRDENDRTERLATFLAMDEMDRSRRLADLQPLAMDTVAARRTAQKQGEALPPLQPGGTPRYPVRNADELGKAIHAVGRGKGNHDAIRKYIIGRAKALGKPNMIPSAWKSDGSAASMSLMPHDPNMESCALCKNKG